MVGGHYSDAEQQLHRIALYEVVAFIEQTAMPSEQEILLFKTSGLNKIYCPILERLADSILPGKDFIRAKYAH